MIVHLEIEAAAEIFKGFIELEPMNRVKETISRIMCRETELFESLLLNDLNKCIKAYVEK